MKNNKHFGEIIQSSLNSWLAQTWKWDQFPTFGSLVTIKTSSRILYAVVYQVHTGSIDASRQPFAYQKTEEELRREQPQIFEFLQTTFSCLCIGYEENGVIYHQLSPEPPKIHAFVGFADEKEYQKFFEHEHYLHVLFGLTTNLVNLDELLLAMLKNMQIAGILTTDKLKSFTQNYSLLTGNDYRRLKLFLQRAEHNINNKYQSL